MKYVAKKKQFGYGFEHMNDEFDQEVKILDIIQKNNAENIIAKQIYNNRKHVCIWMEYGQCNLEKFSLERVSIKDFWQQDELLNLTLQLVEFSLKLYKAGIFHNDIKPPNLIL